MLSYLCKGLADQHAFAAASRPHYDEVGPTLHPRFQHSQRTLHGRCLQHRSLLAADLLKGEFRRQSGIRSIDFPFRVEHCGFFGRDRALLLEFLKDLSRHG